MLGQPALPTSPCHRVTAVVRARGRHCPPSTPCKDPAEGAYASWWTATSSDTAASVGPRPAVRANSSDGWMGCKGSQVGPASHAVTELGAGNLITTSASMVQKQGPGAEGKSPRMQHRRPQSLPCHVGNHDTWVLDPSSRISFLAEETQLRAVQRGHPGGVWAARPAAAPRLG